MCSVACQEICFALLIAHAQCISRYSAFVLTSQAFGCDKQNNVGFSLESASLSSPSGDFAKLCARLLPRTVQFVKHYRCFLPLWALCCLYGSMMSTKSRSKIFFAYVSKFVALL
mmetsp:Transcript_2812/g.4012  ORF Transcript_2812/g.4012 Transcript_2812/m.4012 type:complete len:114 (-) Transcript_2812:53-394(-)